MVMAMIQGTSRDVLENGNQRGGIRPERARAGAGFRPRGEVK